jgi:hypothetical protein
MRATRAFFPSFLAFKEVESCEAAGKSGANHNKVIVIRQVEAFKIDFCKQ